MMKRIIMAIMIMSLFMLMGCDVSIRATDNDHGADDDMKSVDKKEPTAADTEDDLSKYNYDCNAGGDHSGHDYALQDELTKRCQDKCCGGEYCEKCQWLGYGDCFNKCESDLPEGVCRNCDGVCWEQGHEEFLTETAATC